jgi:ketosteroid isomerase-like protein
MRAWLEQWQTWTTTAEQFIDLGDRVLVLSRSRGISSSGLEVDVETAELHEFREGRIVRTVSYPTRAEALERVDLPS